MLALRSYSGANEFSESTNDVPIRYGSLLASRLMSPFVILFARCCGVIFSVSGIEGDDRAMDEDETRKGRSRPEIDGVRLKMLRLDITKTNHI